MIRPMYILSLDDDAQWLLFYNINNPYEVAA